MARIRSIKPEFPQSESIGKLSRDARLLFIQLWTLVDDDGRTRAASRMLASLLYPYDDDARELIEGWLRELEDGDHIVRYEVDGSSYLEICNWLKHQKIDHPTKSKLPPFREDSRVIREASRSLAPDQDRIGKDQDRKGVEQRARARDADPAFERFWASWPHKVGKPAAEKAFRRVSDRVDEILAGVERYIRAKPPDRPWLNPATFLNQERWSDEPAPNARDGPSHQPKRFGEAAAYVLAEIESAEFERQANEQNLGHAINASKDVGRIEARNCETAQPQFDVFCKLPANGTGR